MKRKTLIALIALTLIVIIGYLCISPPTLQTEVGYLTATQGLEAHIAALYWKDAWWSLTETPYGWKPSSKVFNFRMVFDPDDATTGWCDLAVEQQPFVITEKPTAPYKQWLAPVAALSPTGESVYKQIDIYQYKLEWRLNIFLTGTEQEAVDPTGPALWHWEPNYAGAQIWIKLVPRTEDVVFKEAPSNFYIAPAAIRIKAFHVYGAVKKDDTYELTENDPDILHCVDMVPRAEGAAVEILYARGGTPVDISKEILYCEGQPLNPAIFRTEYWIHFDLTQFKPYNYWVWNIWHGWKWPSVQIEFEVYVWVIGEWTYYFTAGQWPSLKPHTPPSLIPSSPLDWLFKAIANFFQAIVAFFRTVGGFFLLLLILPIIAIILIIVILALKTKRR